MSPFIMWSSVGIIVAIMLIVAMMLRRVVETNEVHTVQSRKLTTSYGKESGNGNVYYEWPSWLPVIGITKIVMPVSVFDIELNDYEAYDLGRLPFKVDIKAFFRISDANMAAERVSSIEELKSQLEAIVQGAVRSILASNDIEEIMQGRAKFGELFTKEVDSNISNWGVLSQKSIELMDIRDSQGSQVIANIMEKKKSMIERESRVEVAENMKVASIAEINARREAEVTQQEADKAIGESTADKDKAVGIANEKASQSIKEQALVTTEKTIKVEQAEKVGRAEIDKEVKVVKANEEKQYTVIKAEGELEATKHASEGVRIAGAAEADAEKAMQLAPVEAQIVLAKEIGANQGFQHYLVTLEGVKAFIAVGSKQAEALKDSDLKVIVNAGDTSNGVNNIMDIFSAKGGGSLMSMLESLKSGDGGKALLERLGVKMSDKPSATAVDVATGNAVSDLPTHDAPPKQTTS